MLFLSHLGKSTTAVLELTERSRLQNLTGLKHEKFVATFNGGHSMSDNNHGTASSCLLESILDKLLTFLVKSGCSLIQK